MEILVQEDALASLMTEDPFCACAGVKTLEAKLHHERWRKSNRICVCTSKSGICPVCLPVIC